MAGFQAEVTTTSASESVTLPFVTGYTYNCTVDWGDGSSPVSVTAWDDADATHVYATADSYVVEITGACPAWSVNNTHSSKLQWTARVYGGDAVDFDGWQYLTGGWYGCANLGSLGSGSILSDGLTSLLNTFRSIGAGTSGVVIPSEIFDGLPSVTNISSMFISAKLDGSLPSGLFDSFVNVTNLARCFQAATGLTGDIPSRFFAELTSATFWNYAFYQVSGVRIPGDLWYSDGEQSTRFLDKSSNFFHCFDGCGTDYSDNVLPDVWTCDFGSATPSHDNWIDGHSDSTVTNWDDIPSTWDGDTEQPVKLSISCSISDVEATRSLYSSLNTLSLSLSLSDIETIANYSSTLETLSLSLSISDIEYDILSNFDFKSYARSAFAIYAMDAFGNDTVGNFVWERRDGGKDLVIGNGVDTDTFPTFVSNSDHETDYYSFDGVDDHFSSWPTMPDEYTVVAALSDSYPDGQPYIQSCNDSTIETMLTTSGGYTGNVHNMIVYDKELSAVEIDLADKYHLRRLWRDTFVDPFTARLIRAGDCALCLYCEEEASRFDDYSGKEIGSTDYSTVWDNGLIFPTSSAAMVMDVDTALDLDEVTFFIHAPNFDDLAGSSGKNLFQKKDNYSSSISKTGITATVYFTGSSINFTVSNHQTIAITAKTGEKPKFYIDGFYIGEGDIIVTLDTTGGVGPGLNQLTIGNNSGKYLPMNGVLKKLMVFNRVLTDLEIRASHIMALAERPFTV